MTPARTAPSRADIARQNADIFLTALGVGVPIMISLAFVAVIIDALASSHGHPPVSLAPYFHRFMASSGLVFLARVGEFFAVILFVLTLESLVLQRRAFAADIVENAAEALAVVRTVFVGRLLDVLTAADRPVRASWLRGPHEAENGILHQLRSALSIAPAAPPASSSFAASPPGSLTPTSHRVEVSPAA